MRTGSIGPRAQVGHGGEENGRQAPEGNQREVLDGVAILVRVDVVGVLHRIHADTARGTVSGSAGGINYVSDATGEA